MTNSFLFNGDVVLHLLAVVFSIIAAVFNAACIVSRYCRRDFRFDEDGRRRDDA
mgnify:CR=1 FL=1